MDAELPQMYVVTDVEIRDVDAKEIVNARKNRHIVQVMKQGIALVSERAAMQQTIPATTPVIPAMELCQFQEIMTVAVAASNRMNQIKLR